MSESAGIWQGGYKESAGRASNLLVLDQMEHILLYSWDGKSALSGKDNLKQPNGRDGK